MASTHEQTAASPHDEGETRRDFLMLAAGAFGAFAAGAAVWPLVSQMNPAADTLAASTTEVDLSPIQEGQSITIAWRGKPVFIRHRTKAEIEQAQAVNVKDLPDPQTDAARVKRAQWLIVVGVCTHLGCVPQGQKAGEVRGQFGGWFCPCHGSAYDTSGRIRLGPAPKNLEVPAYEFLENSILRIG
ncbi:MAG: ubiquinol-cytochrome c reductase iron-sulfur subunit [Alphaproteobacteria bacterium]|nr:ubiquinol-cytochrome c reductase iron-sulfur subunit [Alphaproteobacteria bacterium]